jgi:hypothetical protein
MYGSGRPRSRSYVKLGAAIASGALALAAAPAAGELIEVGDTGSLPDAACPQADTCQAVGQVTGFQIQVGTARNPFRVARDGRVVALTLKLPEPTAKQVDFFNDAFGGPPRVRVAILRPRPQKGERYRYVLAGQSETIALTDFLGSTPTFPLLRSLRVVKGDVIGLTAETWMPAFAVGLDNANAWRSSRPAGDCENVRDAAVHDDRGAVRVYGCLYRTARLLYSATLITDPKRTTKPDRRR